MRALSGFMPVQSERLEIGAIKDRLSGPGNAPVVAGATYTVPRGALRSMVITSHPTLTSVKGVVSVLPNAR
jgi:hypothetical protein